jgi:hypothetical protein
VSESTLTAKYHWWAPLKDDQEPRDVPDEVAFLTFPASCIPPETVYIGVSTSHGVSQRSFTFSCYEVPQA